MDTTFEDVFSDYNIQQRLDILGYGSRDAYLEAEPTIEAKAKDMVEHYLAHVFPQRFTRRQVVATSREAAVRYKKHLDAALAAAVAKLEQAEHGQAGPGPPQGDEDRRRDLQTQQRPARTSKSIPTQHGTRRASRASNWRSAVKRTVSAETCGHPDRQ